MGNSAKRDARAAEQAEKQRKALEFRKAGANYDQIADQMKLPNRSVAWKLVKAGIKTIVREPAEGVLLLELARLDALLLGCWQKAKSGDTQSIDRALRIMERRSSYLGLDQPRGLKVEMAREIDGFLERVRHAVPPDVYERVLAVAAGEPGAPPIGGNPSDEAGEDA